MKIVFCVAVGLMRARGVDSLGVNPLQGGLYMARVIPLALVMAFVLVAPKGALLPTNQIATVGRFRW